MICISPPHPDVPHYVSVTNDPFNAILNICRRFLQIFILALKDRLSMRHGYDTHHTRFVVEKSSIMNTYYNFIIGVYTYCIPARR